MYKGQSSRCSRRARRNNKKQRQHQQTTVMLFLAQLSSCLQLSFPIDKARQSKCMSLGICGRKLQLKSKPLKSTLFCCLMNERSYVQYLHLKTVLFSVVTFARGIFGVNWGFASWQQLAFLLPIRGAAVWFSGRGGTCLAFACAALRWETFACYACLCLVSSLWFGSAWISI